MNDSHEFLKRTAVDGDGKRHNWHQCTSCGTAKHSGYFWLGGYKSRNEPHCFDWPVNQPKLIEWQNKAIIAV